MRTQKTPSDIYWQYKRMFHKSSELGQKFAAIADPATGGNSLYCHNWGNDASKAVWQRVHLRWAKLHEIESRLFNKAEHEMRHKDIRPMDTSPLQHRANTAGWKEEKTCKSRGSRMKQDSAEIR